MALGEERPAWDFCLSNMLGLLRGDDSPRMDTCIMVCKGVRRWQALHWTRTWMRHCGRP